MEIESFYVCAFCFEVVETLVDASAGENQEYIEDCQVCCRPNNLTVRVDPRSNTAEITAEVS